MSDRKTIYLDDAIEAICKACSMEEDYHKCDGYPETSTWCDNLVALRALPSAQPEPSIPLSWFDGQIERLKGLDNAFATLTALQISGMLKKWSGEQNG